MEPERTRKGATVPRTLLLAGLLGALLPTSLARAEGPVEGLQRELESLAILVSARLEILAVCEKAGMEAEAAAARRKLLALLDRQRAVLDTLAREVRAILREREEAQREKEEKPPDPRMERIRAYAEGRASLFDWRRLTDLLKDETADARHRQSAADALRERFKNLNRGDAQVARLMMKIGHELHTRLMDRDERVRTWVHGVFKVFWPGRAQVIGFRPDDMNYRARYKAWKEWRHFLAQR
jgi:hypothetical protein